MPLYRRRYAKRCRDPWAQASDLMGNLTANNVRFGQVRPG